MFNRENQHDIFDLFHKYPITFGYAPLMSQMHTEILATFAEASGNVPDFGDIGDLVYASTKSKDVVPRKCAWIASQVLGSGHGRAVAVNQRILKKKSRLASKTRDVQYTSPLVNGLDCYDLISELAWHDCVDEEMAESVCKESVTLDVLLLDMCNTVIYAVKAIGAKQLKRISKGLMHGSAMPNLFTATDRPLGNAFVPGYIVKQAQYAAMTISLACSDIQVIPLVMVVDEEDGSWFFQANRVPLTPLGADDLVCLDDYPIEESILSFVAGTGRADVDLSCISVHPPNNYLNMLPVDRATRPLMFLDQMVIAFHTNPNDLTIWRGADLHNAVRRNYKVSFDRDIGRHDLEDCLRQSGWIQSPPSDRSKFYLTAPGLALSKFVEQRFSSESVNFGPSVIRDMQILVNLEIKNIRLMSR